MIEDIASDAHTLLWISFMLLWSVFLYNATSDSDTEIAIGAMTICSGLLHSLQLFESGKDLAAYAVLKPAVALLESVCVLLLGVLIAANETSDMLGVIIFAYILKAGTAVTLVYV